MGPPVDSVQLVYKWLNSMVYGRYNYSYIMGIILVYKPTNITGGPLQFGVSVNGELNRVTYSSDPDGIKKNGLVIVHITDGKITMFNG